MVELINKAPDEKTAQTEVVLAALRTGAIDEFLKSGKTVNMETTGNRTDGGLRLDTLDRGTNARSAMLVGGEAKLSTNGPPVLGQSVAGDFMITPLTGANRGADKVHIDINNGLGDTWMMRTDASVKMTRTNAQGELMQAYNPAKMSPIAGKFYSNGDPALAAEGIKGANCAKDNPANQYNKRTNCAFLIDDAKLGQLSYFERSENLNRHYMDGVLRRGDQVLGVVRQDYKLDANGDISNSRITIRKSTLK
jgi:hypothetical protein